MATPTKLSRFAQTQSALDTLSPLIDKDLLLADDKKRRLKADVEALKLNLAQLSQSQKKALNILRSDLIALLKAKYSRDWCFHYHCHGITVTGNQDQSFNFQGIEQLSFNQLLPVIQALTEHPAHKSLNNQIEKITTRYQQIYTIATEALDASNKVAVYKGNKFNEHLKSTIALTERATSKIDKFNQKRYKNTQEPQTPQHIASSAGLNSALNTSTSLASSTVSSRRSSLDSDTVSSPTVAKKLDFNDKTSSGLTWWQGARNKMSTFVKGVRNEMSHFVTKVLTLFRGSSSSVVSLPSSPTNKTTDTTNFCQAGKQPIVIAARTLQALSKPNVHFGELFITSEKAAARAQTAAEMADSLPGNDSTLSRSRQAGG